MESARGMEDHDGFGPRDLAALVDVSRETLTDLERFRQMLAKWNRRVDLVGPRELARFWRRHALDSAQLLAHAPETATNFVDLGSGAGFPGIVLALQLRERRGAQLQLVESDQKKAAFLRQALHELRAPAFLLNRRIESTGRESLPSATGAGIAPGRADIISARALAPLPKLFEYANLWLTKKGCGLFLKGQDVEAELTAASISWKCVASRIPSLADPGGVVLRVEALSRV